MSLNYFPHRHGVFSLVALTALVALIRSFIVLKSEIVPSPESSVTQIIRDFSSVSYSSMSTAVGKAVSLRFAQNISLWQWLRMVLRARPEATRTAGNEVWPKILSSCKLIY